MRYGLVLVGLVALALLAPRPAPADRGGADLTDLSAEERAAVRKLVEKELKARGLFKGKVYLTGIDVMPDNHEGTPRRALVTHYRYEGDLAIVTAVDLDGRRVLGVEAVPHMPASLAPEEYAEAVRLARAHPEVVKMFERYRGKPIEIDAVLTRSGERDAPRARHRFVRLYFRQGRDYLLYAPDVTVDLTAGTVRAERAGKSHP